ncbi:4'-phosphopantetheinyl transferase family protein [Methylobacterium oryzihabitans]|uniref:4'-phosphopantetheinyl transferase superfamily protein n=1 Tax=Methylobacterium oryzihabitans TaxID=2499852 RepID=A0A3S2VDG5_9HYPH|nr:4'-phosphopantetheinyl transferase superfamily protein [Methylobacterium oryzihabitans]RVU20293.1 4'-phosphopantetheinyl transferase superfamily protein [Methylobacterium oryzihabitans]
MEDGTIDEAAAAAARLAPGEAVAVAIPAGRVGEVLPPRRLALPPDECARIARYRQPQDRLEREAAHGLLRHLAAPLLGRAPADLVLARDGRGRPFLREAVDLDLDFNLSHGAGWVAVALARGGRVGIDVEGAARPVDWDALAPHVLHPDELAAFRALPAARRPGHALDLWTLKEACLKASGEGLAVHPPSVRLTPAGAEWHIDRSGLPLRATVGLLPDAARLALARQRDLHPRIVVVA